MNIRSKVRPLAIGAVLLGVVATGCGATGGAGAPGGATEQVSSAIAPQAQTAAFLAKSAKTTAAVTSEKVSLTVSTAPKGGEPSISVTSEGAIDAANSQAHLTADLSGSFGEHRGSTSIETIYDGDTVYLKAPFIEMFSEGKPWVKVTSGKLADAAAQLGGTVQADPGAFLTFLEGAGGEVKTLGTEDVRGVPTRHVSVEIDPAKVLDQAGKGERKKLEEHLKAHGIALSDLGTLPAEAWIDDDGYVRRFSTSYDLSQLNGLGHEGKGEGHGADLDTTITETIELYDFNEPVDITVPPAADVHEIDLSKLLGD